MITVGPWEVKAWKEPTSQNWEDSSSQTPPRHSRSDTLLCESPLCRCSGARNFTARRAVASPQQRWQAGPTGRSGRAQPPESSPLAPPVTHDEAGVEIKGDTLLFIVKRKSKTAQDRGDRSVRAQCKAVRQATPHGLALGNRFQDETPGARATKGKTAKLDSIDM